VFVDIHTNALFHGHTPHIKTPSNRHINSNNRRQALRYIDAIDKQNNIPELLQKLRQLSKLSKWKEEHHVTFENIDKAFTTTLLRAEQQTKLPNNADWHPKLHHCYQIYLYWKINVAGTINNVNTQQKLTNIEKHMHDNNIDIYQSNQQRPAIYQLCHAKNNLKLQRATAYEQRQQHLTFRQEVMLLEGKKSMACANNTVQRTKRRSRCFQKFHTYTKSQRSNGGLTHVLIPANNGTTSRIQEPKALAIALSSRNQKHFSQADGTPYYLQFSGVTPIREDILEGNPLPLDLPTPTTDILSELQRVRQPPSHIMSFDAMIAGLSKWRESTITSPSGKHLGHYKTLVQHYKYNLHQQKKQKKYPHQTQIQRETHNTTYQIVPSRNKL
jgi:hypothetical protein